jgi:hypothetical protein
MSNAGLRLPQRRISALRPETMSDEDGFNRLQSQGDQGNAADTGARRVLGLPASAK